MEKNLNFNVKEINSTVLMLLKRIAIEKLETDRTVVTSISVNKTLKLSMGLAQFSGPA